MELNKIYNENCLETMKRMSDNFVDLTVTSPPYDNLRAYNGYSFEFESIAKELFRVTKVGGVVVWIIGDSTTSGSESGTSFKQALFFMEIGFNLHDTMIWHKTALFPHHKNAKRYKQQFEYMFVFTKGTIKTHNPICDVVNDSFGKTLSIKTKIKSKNNGVYNGRVKAVTISEFRMRDNVWEYGQQGFKGHPAPFPEKLAKDHIISWSNEGDIVYDPFIGSGTTGKMALILKRKYIGSEISEEYTKLAEERIKQFSNPLF